MPVSSIIGGVATLGGALLSSSASKSAANTQANSADAASATQLQMYNQTRDDQAPWRNVGGSAINQLAYLAGLSPTQGGSTSAGPGGAQFGDLVYDSGTGQWTSPTLRNQAAEGGNFGPNDEARYQALIQQRLGGIDNPVQAYQNQTAATQATANADPAYGSLTRGFTMADYQADPGYQFRLDQGQQALERSAAARGGLLSGGALKDTTAYAQGAASQEYGNAYNRFNNDQANVWNRLSGLAGVGQQANNTIAQVGSNTVSQIGQNTIGAGNAIAAGQVGSANAINGAITQGISGYQNNQLLNLFANQQRT